MTSLIKQLNEGYSAYLVSKSSQKDLKELFPPKFSEFIGHHITYKYPASASEVPSSPRSVQVIGYASEDGLEALVVSVNGKKTRRQPLPHHMVLGPKQRQEADGLEQARQEGIHRSRSHRNQRQSTIHQARSIICPRFICLAGIF